MGWLNSLLGIPFFPGSGGGNGGPMGYHPYGQMRDPMEMRMQGLGEHALYGPHGNGMFAQRWQQAQQPGYAPPEPPPAFGGYAPPEGPPMQMPPTMSFGQQLMQPPKFGQPPPMQAMRFPPPTKGVIRK
jgi:hypothetical protein